MSEPFWFNAIVKWKELDYGEYGLTFPFLIGAAAKFYNEKADEKFVRKVFSEIENNPVKGYYCEVRWCGNIDEPVASIKPLSDLAVVSIKGKLFCSGQVSMGFTKDLMSMFHLDCTTPEECREKLIQKTLGITNTGMWSKNLGRFTEFNETDKKFIEHVVSISST